MGGHGVRGVVIEVLEVLTLFKEIRVDSLRELEANLIVEEVEVLRRVLLEWIILERILLVEETGVKRRRVHKIDGVEEAVLNINAVANDVVSADNETTVGMARSDSGAETILDVIPSRAVTATNFIDNAEFLISEGW